MWIIWNVSFTVKESVINKVISYNVIYYSLPLPLANDHFTCAQLNLTLEF